VDRGLIAHAPSLPRGGPPDAWWWADPLATTAIAALAEERISAVRRYGVLCSPPVRRWAPAAGIMSALDEGSSCEPFGREDASWTRIKSSE
jgi:hypothetical protein